MRKVIITNMMTLDGYYEGPGADVYALPMDDAFEAYNAERLRTAGTVLAGRTTYDIFRTYWPTKADDEHEVTRFIARRLAEIDKLVVSDTLTDGDTDPWAGSTRIVSRADAAAGIAEIKRGDRLKGGQFNGDQFNGGLFNGGDILVYGSRQVWLPLLSTGLVDEFHIQLGAKVIGGGTPMFAGAVPASFRLIDVRIPAGSNNPVLRYALD
jgi:dihydrofolate reductase